MPNAKIQQALDERIEDFIHASAILKLNDDESQFYLDIENGRMDNLRGPQTRLSVEIQGPEGDNHVRVAFQERSLVLAQVILPRKKIINIETFKDALVKSAKHKKEVIFGSEDDIVRSANLNNRKNNNRNGRKY